MATMKKITELIINKDISFSFEVTPDIDVSEIDQLTTQPTFFSVTWHAKSHGCKDLDIAPIKTAKALKKKGKEVLLHLSCDLLRRNYLNELIDTLQRNGICNLFVVLGEGYNEENSDFKTSQELIRYIRERSGDYFCIGVAGFATDDEDKLLRLKDKIESGANFILTQAIFDANEFQKCIIACNRIGINVPILAGLFIFETRDQLIPFAKLCKINVPEHFLDAIANKTEEEVLLVQKKLINDIHNVNPVNIHIFTLNKLTRAVKCINKIKK